jgi:hypothetical protein
MKAFRICILFLLLPLFSPILALASDERLTLNAKINGETIRLAFDTGAPAPLIILSPTAKKLSLKTEERNGEKFAFFTIYIEGHEIVNAQALVMDSLPFPDIDGLVGWPALLGNIWRVRWENMSLSLMPSIPEEIFSWQPLKLDTQGPLAAALLFENSDGLVFLDTGHPGGIALSESRWNKWVQENSHLPRTLKSGYLPAAGGIFFTELSWANSFKLGPLEFPCVVIEKNVIKWPKLEAVLGIEALKHFEIVFDRISNRIYLKKRPYSSEKFPHNRLGATFLPSSLESDSLVGYVLKNSPAYKAGLRSGDILLKIDDTDMTHWKTDPTIWKREFWEAKPGTKYIIEVERNTRKHKFTVTLEEILNIPIFEETGAKK